MFKLIKYLVIAVVVLVVAIFGIIMTTDVNQYKPKIIELVKNTTKRDFNIEGDLKLAPSLIPTLKVSGVTFGNAAWGEKKPMVSVGDFEAQVALMPLLKKNIQVNKLILNKPEILLETNKDGVGNWVLDTGPSKQKTDDTSSQDLALNVNEIQINDASLVYRDGKTGKTNELEVDEIRVESSGSSSPVELLVKSTLNDAPLNIDGELGSLDSLMANKESPIDITIDLGKAEISAQGKVSKPKSMQGLDLNFNVEIDRLADLSKLAGQELPDAGPISLSGKLSEANGIYSIKADGNIIDATLSADGKLGNAAMQGLDINIDFAVDNVSSLSALSGSELPDAGPVKVAGQLKQAKGGYAINGMKATILEYNVNGDASINTQGERPSLVATLSTDTLDLSEFTEAGDDKKAAKKEKVFSSDPLPLDKLKSADVKLNFTANKLITSSMSLDNAKLALNLINGKLDIAPFSGNIAGGSLSANVSLDGSNGKTAVLNNEVSIKQVELGQLPQFKGKDTIIGGKTDFTMNISGSGASVAEIMAGANGNLLMITGSGKLYNKTINIAGADIVFSALDMINPLSEQEEYTSLECGVLKFDIKDGIATTDRGIAMQTGKINIAGSGTLNFKTEEVDLAVKPQAREGLGISLGSLADAVKIGGTLANPKPKVSTAAALKTGLTAGAAVATGGISLLAEGLFNKVTTDGNPCDIALGKAAKPAEKSSETEKPKDPVSDTKQQTEQKVEQKKEQIEEKKEEVEDKIEDALKGFF